MKASDWISIAGIGLTLCTVIANLLFTLKMSKRSDYISRLTDFKLRWIDNARMPIAEYLLSIDRLQRCEDNQVKRAYDSFLEKHWALQCFLTLFSPKEEKARELLEDIYYLAYGLTNDTANRREYIRFQLQNKLIDANLTMRDLMDKNWAAANEDIKGKKQEINKNKQEKVVDSSQDDSEKAKVQ